MDFFVIGLSHHQAPVEVREKFASLLESERHLYDYHQNSGVVTESLVLSTCNRLEILAVTDDLPAGREAVLESLVSISGLTLAQISPFVHEYVGLEAARHLFRVAASLDSLVVGEPQILGQVKEAFRQSINFGRAGALVTKLMHLSFRAAKRIRSSTNLTRGTVSVASAAVALAERLRGGDLGQASALVLGAGPMAALALAHLRKKNPQQLVLMNRSLAKAENMALAHCAIARPWAELNQAVVEADLIVAATGAQKPILTLDQLEKPMAQRPPTKPLIIIDIGLPRNASHDVKRLPQVILRNIDDLNEVVWEGRALRKEAAEKAEEIVEEEVDKLEQWLHSLTNRPTVAALAIKAENIRRYELERTMAQHHFSPGQKAALEAMTSALVRRLMHDPISFIKQAKSHSENSGCRQSLKKCRGKKNCLTSIRRAFNIDHDQKYDS